MISTIPPGGRPYQLPHGNIEHGMQQLVGVQLTMAESCVIIGLGQIGMGYDFDLTGEVGYFTTCPCNCDSSRVPACGRRRNVAGQRTVFEQRYGVPPLIRLETACGDSCNPM